MAVTTVVVALVIGLPAGLAVASLSWASVARDVYVASDTLVPATTLLMPIGALAVALLAAIVPAHRVSRDSPARQLRAE
jgi:hypothetical protein